MTITQREILIAILAQAILAQGGSHPLAFMYPVVLSLGGTEVPGATDGRHVCLAVTAWATLGGTLTPATQGAPPTPTAAPASGTEAAPPPYSRPWLPPRSASAGLTRGSLLGMLGRLSPISSIWRPPRGQVACPGDSKFHPNSAGSKKARGKKKLLSSHLTVYA